MFDTSFARSRVYFKSLQLLRIFSQTIRSTRTGIRQLDPERFKKRKWDRQFSTSSTRPLISPESNPAEDDILLANWKILWTFYVEAESRLLGQIAEKTDEIKSLRDGVIHSPAFFFLFLSISSLIQSSTSCSTPPPSGKPRDPRP